VKYHACRKSRIKWPQSVRGRSNIAYTDTEQALVGFEASHKPKDSKGSA
jgi:hypothetical protein